MEFEIDNVVNFMGSVVAGAQKAQKGLEGLSQMAAKTSETVQSISNATQSLNQVITSFKDTSTVLQTFKSTASDLIKSFSADIGKKATDSASKSGKVSKVSKAASTGQKAVKTSKVATGGTKGIGAGISNAVKSISLDKVKSTIGKVGETTGTFLKNCVDDAEKAKAVQNDLARTIKATGGAAGVTAGEVSKMASQLSNTSTFGSGAIETGQNILLKYNTIGKDVFPMASKAMVDMAQSMGKEPAEASKILGKALDNPINGIEDLIETGVTFTEGQKSQIQTMQKAGDMAGAQRMMLSALNGEVGGKAAEAADTYNGKMKQIINTIGDIKTRIGDALLPYIKKAEDVFLGMAQSIKNLPAPVMDVIVKILSFVAVIGTLIGGFGMFKNMITSFFPSLSPLLKIFGGLPLPMKIVIGVIALLAVAFATNFGGIRDLVVGVFNKISGAVKSAIDVFKKTGSAAEGIGTLFTNLFGPKVGTAVSNTVKVITTIVKTLIEYIKAHMPQIKSTIQNVFQGIQAVWNSILKPVLMFAIQIFGKLVNWVVTNWPLIKQTITTVMTAIKNVITTVLNTIKSFWDAHGQTIKIVVTAAFNNIKTIITTILNVVTGVIKAVMQVINGDWSGAWNTVKITVSTVFRGAIDVVKNILTAIGAIFKDMGKTALTWGKDLIQGIIDGIKSKIEGITSAVTGVAEKIRSFLHFSVPDQGPLTDYESWMPDFLKGMGTGIKVNTHLVTDPVKDLSVGIKTNLNKNLSGGSTKTASGATTSGKKDTEKGFAITIAKLADSIIIREENDIDKIATALANKLANTALGMS